MRRREFIALVGAPLAFGAVTSRPFVARAQSGKPKVFPKIGLLHSTSLSYFAKFQDAVWQGLNDAGWTDRKDLQIEYRWAEGKPENLPALAADLVSHNVAVIFAVGGSAPAKAAKMATSTIPIVFISAADPVKAGLVASLNRPSGNVTGVSLVGSSLETKRLGILHQLVPTAVTIGVLIDPKYPDMEDEHRELKQAADALKQLTIFVNASTVNEIDAAFATFSEKRVDALAVTQDIFFNTHNEQITRLATRNRMPAIYNQREFPVVGGLISYGPSFIDGYRQAGLYVGKVLSGENPADLPVQQPTRFEIVINLKTANALGLNVPPALLAIADEVIE